MIKTDRSGTGAGLKSSFQAGERTPVRKSAEKADKRS